MGLSQTLHVLKTPDDPEGFDDATDDLDEIEIDEPNPEEEGDDSIFAELPSEGLRASPKRLASLAATNLTAVTGKVLSGTGAKKRKKLFVPFVRNFKFRDRSLAIIGYKRALSRAGYLRWTQFIPFYGRTMRSAVRHFRKDHGLPVNDKIDKAFHTKLVKARAKHKPGMAFDSKAAWLIQQDKQRWDELQQKNQKLKKEQLIREKMRASCWFVIHNRTFIHYTQSALRMYGIRNRIKPPQVTRWEDCSSMVTYICWLAGVPDPNDLHYNGLGFTGTMYTNGAYVASLATAKTGCGCFYGHFLGYNGITHTTMLMEKIKGRWCCMSHGREQAPEFIPADYRTVLGIRDYVSA
jgi:peptidoglycan hydrolase-like protein with peptidoglycan-binding domain